MSDEKPTGAVDEQVADSSGSGSADVDWRAEAEKWKQFSRTWEERAKANLDAKKRLDELEQESLTESEKLQKKLAEQAERVAELEARERELDRARVRAEIASEFKLSVEDRDLFLTGDDEDMLRRQAEALAARGGAEAPHQGQGGSRGSVAEAQSWAQSLLGKKNV